jgi:hypothetical protein
MSDLIDALVNSHAPRPVQRPLAFTLWGGAGVALGLALIVGGLGTRADLASLPPMLLYKHGFGLVLLSLGGLVAARFASPAYRLSAAMGWAALLVLGALQIPVIQALMGARSLAVFQPHTGWQCLMWIGLAGLPTLGLALMWLKRGAPSRPGLAGLWAGLAAAGAGICAFALHCPHDAAAYIGLWYGLAALTFSLLGGALGRRFLRW